MISGPNSRAAWVALSALLTLALGRWVDGARVLDGSRFGVGGAPVDVAVSSDGSRILAAAADDGTIAVLDRVGRVLNRQAFEGDLLGTTWFERRPIPIGLVWDGGEHPPLAMFFRSPTVCEIRLDNSTARSRCFDPGISGTVERRRDLPVVLGMTTESDGALVVALGQIGEQVDALRLRRLRRESPAGQFQPVGESGWIPRTRQVFYGGRYPMEIDPRSGKALVLEPGTGRLLAFDRDLVLEREVTVARLARAMAIDATGSRLYVGDALTGEVLRLEPESLQVDARAQTRTGIRALAIDREAGAVWILFQGVEDAVALDLGDLSVRAHGGPIGPAVSGVVESSTRSLLLASPASGTVSSWPIPALVEDDADRRPRPRWTTRLD